MTEFFIGVNIPENDMCDFLYNGSRIHYRFLYFALYILFFIGKEVIYIARSADIVLSEKSVKRISYFFAQRNFICADVIRHQNHDIIKGCFNIVADISDKIQQFQNRHVILFDSIAIIGGSLTTFDDSTNRTVKERMKRIVEHIKRNERRFVFFLNFLSRFLKTGKHRTFAIRLMFSCVSVLTDFIEHSLHKSELIRHERIIYNKVVRSAIPLNVEHRIRKREKVTKNGIVSRIKCFKVGNNRIFLL